MSPSLQSLRSRGPRLLRTSSLQRTYATAATSIATRQSVANLLKESITAGKHAVTAVQCTVLPIQSSIIGPAYTGTATTLGSGEEDTRLGLSGFTAGAATLEVPEEMVKIQALVELIVKAKDFGEVKDAGILDV